MFFFFLLPVVAWVPLIHGGMQHSDTLHKVLQNVIVWIYGGMQHSDTLHKVLQNVIGFMAECSTDTLHKVLQNVIVWNARRLIFLYMFWLCQSVCLFSSVHLCLPLSPSLSFPFDQGSGKHSSPPKLCIRPNEYFFLPRERYT